MSFTGRGTRVRSAYYCNAENESQPEKTDVETIVEAVPNGPLMVYGNIRVKNTDGTETIKHKVTAFCRCGSSQNKPYCDGTHRKTGFEG